MRKQLLKRFDEAKEHVHAPGVDPRLQASAMLHMIQTCIALFETKETA